jgi:hypothetical protein
MMTKLRLAVLVAGLGWLPAVEPVVAHHAFSAEFDIKKPVKLSGVVTKVEWTNPHAWFYVDVKDEAGKVSNWGLELGSPNGLIRAGWTRSSIKVGDVVSVEGFQALNGSPIANARLVVQTATGQQLYAASSSGR